MTRFTQNEKGNALIYVLIAIALFAALSMTMGRQTGTGEASALSDDKAELYATQLIGYTAQTKSVVDQMMFGGSKIDDLVFTLPTQAGFNTPPHIQKVYHPEGGGLNPGRLAEEAIAQTDDDPAAGWYMGRFNNVEWTKTSATDVILVAYQINMKICERINLKVTGSADIPLMTDTIKNTMIDDTFHNGTNIDLTTDPASTPVCAECHKRSALCVKDGSGAMYGFYTVIADR